MEGPRTASWVLKFVDRNGGGFSARLTKFVSEHGLSRSDPFVGFHGLLSEALDWLCSVDQLDVTNLVGVECLLREYQLIEEMKAKAETEGEIEQAYFRGKQKTLRGVCVCPELTAWVADRLRVDNEITKQRAKAKELRERPPGAKPGPKK